MMSRPSTTSRFRLEASGERRIADRRAQIGEQRHLACAGAAARPASMEKRNVMKTGVLWNEVVSQVHAREYRDVQLEHQLADSGGMNLVKWPKQFDVIVTDNLFGDMLSDIAAMLTGSLGMLPSASLGEIDVKTKKRKALYEPVHGSAPDIAGTGLANPIAMIASFGMALRYSFDMATLADQVDAAISAVLDQGSAHRGYQVGRHDGGQHNADGRGDRERTAGAAGLTAHRVPQ